jgi:hypothetical protein
MPSRNQPPAGEAIFLGILVILSAAKNLRDSSEILRCAQNDGSLPARERLPFSSESADAASRYLSSFNSPQSAMTIFALVLPEGDEP